MRLLTLLIVLLVSASASAQSTEINYEMPRECKSRYMAGPGTGVVLSAGAVWFGSQLIWLGSDGFFDRDRGLLGGGAFMVAAGAATMAISFMSIARHRKHRKTLCGPGTLPSQATTTPRVRPTATGIGLTF